MTGPSSSPAVRVSERQDGPWLILRVLFSIGFVTSWCWKYFIVSLQRWLREKYSDEKVTSFKVMQLTIVGRKPRNNGCVHWQSL